MISRYNGQPASGVAVSLATNANALSTADGMAELMEQMKPSFSPGLKVVIPFDTTPFVRVSINEVVKTLKNGRHLVLRGQGHNVIGIGCMPRLMAKFVDGADLKVLDATCLDRLPYTPPFTGFHGWEP